MKIAVIGLGLIGGSVCKSLKLNTEHTVMGYDKDQTVLRAAVDTAAVDRAIGIGALAEAELTFVCLHPRTTLQFIKDNAKSFAKNSIVADVCGVKGGICSEVEPLLNAEGVLYVGTHPMAGKEFSGFAYSDSEMFKGASFIITQTQSTNPEAVKVIKDLALRMGFRKAVCATPEAHDKNIAYTSQLAHIVSSAYVKSPSIKREDGFSAGSFQDLTRVAKLDENLWSSLFMLNRGPLISELDLLIENLGNYRAVLDNGDEGALKALLEEGRIIKEESIKMF